MNSGTAKSLCARCMYGTGKNHRCGLEGPVKWAGQPLHWKRCKHFKPKKEQLKATYQCVCCGHEKDERLAKCPKCGATMKPIVKVQKKLT